ncbi:hypothetical protein BLNAU_3273 [Blattamonas nauphoetae]|uniref:Uncharacterized protein n=1 Tax=Blattamonas nauphoetae TaxID=2049346 RepID=A0ABQ9YDW5_9EUKA|nr:hypothetical protein BLNAU_3273 [Blattamonas nauphoetae]
MIYERTGTGTHHGVVLCALERLLLASNLLTSVLPLVSQFRKLHTLSLAGNGISELKCRFFRSLPNLSRLNLLFNKLTHLPELIVAVSPPAILRNMHSTHPSHTETDFSHRTDAGRCNIVRISTSLLINPSWHFYSLPIIENTALNTMTFSDDDPEYSPFLNWNPDDGVTIQSSTPIYFSLVAMVRDGDQFDEEHLEKAKTFFSSLKRNLRGQHDLEALLNVVGQGSPNPTAVFMDSMAVLLGSSYLCIVQQTLRYIEHCLDNFSPSKRLVFLSCKLIPRILSTPYLRDLSKIGQRLILNDLIGILSEGISVASLHIIGYLRTNFNIDPESIRNVVLHEVLTPIELSLVQLRRNPFILSWKDEDQNVFSLFFFIFEDCAFHQPTMDFICSSHIPTVFQSLLLEVENEPVYQFVIWFLSYNISRWKMDGGDTASRGRLLLQTLEQEGFRDGLVQTQFHDDLRRHGKALRGDSFKIMNDLGMNIPEPETMM